MSAPLRSVDVIREMCADLVHSMAEAHRLRGPCAAGHPVTLENTQRIGSAGYRCKECRRKLARESARRMKALDPERFNQARILRERRKRLADWGYEL